MKVLPVRVNFEFGNAHHEFKIELRNKSLIINDGQIVNDPAISYDPQVPVSEQGNSNALWGALLYMMELLTDQVMTLTETNKNMVAGYLHRRIIKVSNNYFNVPMDGSLLNINAISAATV
jgi:hypothetical protein